MKKILVIDDDSSLKPILSEEMIVIGGNPDIIEYALSGEEGLRKYKEIKPMFVFLDMKMPGMDGLETFERIHDLDKDANVFIVTGYIYDSPLKAIKLGAKGYIAKYNGYVSMIASLINTFDKCSR